MNKDKEEEETVTVSRRQWNALNTQLEILRRESKGRFNTSFHDELMYAPERIKHLSKQLLLHTRNALQAPQVATRKSGSQDVEKKNAEIEELKKKLTEKSNQIRFLNDRLVETRKNTEQQLMTSTKKTAHTEEKYKQMGLKNKKLEAEVGKLKEAMERAEKKGEERVKRLEEEVRRLTEENRRANQNYNKMVDEYCKTFSDL